ncbi:hypothetical protein F9K91_10590 [Brucella tritici]|uniref:Uncharacterized protein n=1 Tax=Brucella tritici TaxID=94626 RepID=A0A833CM93_9HYPH|nr:hypothetical protein [Brucella tritici]KAB2665174.1 hypothetical protein F9K91_10590 [Brucella tritici]
MISGKRLKFMIIDEVGQAHPPRWSHPFSRFGCARSRRVLERFPEKAGEIARATIEGGSRIRGGKAVLHA